MKTILSSGEKLQVNIQGNGITRSAANISEQAPAERSFQLLFLQSPAELFQASTNEFEELVDWQDNSSGNHAAGYSCEDISQGRMIASLKIRKRFRSLSSRAYFYGNAGR